jgi:hypothetical protein
VFTAGITNYFIPRITHEWQQHDRELELRNARNQKEVALKAVLARDIGQSTGSFLAVIHSTELSWRGELGPDYDRAYEKWSAVSSGIATQISVYFPNTKIYDRWREYEDNIYALYSLLKYKDARERQAVLEQIAQYIDDSGLGKRELEVIARFDVPHDDVEASLDVYLKRLLGAFRSRADELITAVLGAHSILTRPGQRTFPGEGVDVSRAQGGEARLVGPSGMAANERSAGGIVGATAPDVMGRGGR